MLFLSNELRFPGAGGAGRLAMIHEQCRPRLGLFPLLKSGFSWHQAEMLWAVTLRKYARVKKSGGGKA